MRNIYLQVIFFILFSSYLFSQETWTKKADNPQSGFYRSGYCTNEYIIIGAAWASLNSELLTR